MNQAAKERSHLHLWIVGAVSLLAASLLFWFDPSRFHFYPLCLFHSATGLWCPGCGSLRALHQLLRGHVVAAFHFNPLLLICLPFFLWYAAARVNRRRKGLPMAGLVRPLWFWLFLAAAVVFGVMRNLPGEPFAMLRP